MKIFYLQVFKKDEKVIKIKVLENRKLSLHTDMATKKA